MIIKELELHHFRNYDDLRLTPHEGINLFFGQNGSGKTNLLEAIHYCSLGKSHRINQDLNAVQMGQEGASCRLSVLGKYVRNDVEVRLRPGEDSVKTVLINSRKVSRLSEMMGVVRCVIFSPEDLNLIREGPAARRRFLDMMISQISRSYFIALQQYRIALNQRNAILRQARMENLPINPMIVDFEASMCEQAKIIYQERQKAADFLSEAGREIYRSISGLSDETLTITYAPSVHGEGDPAELLLHLLQQSREDDLRQGTTSAGPQRDDLGLYLNRKSMKLYASQGQMRTAALSLKLAQRKLIFRMTDDQPVLLLDDVMSELDLRRRMNLLQLIDQSQTFITCADEGDLDMKQGNRTYHVFSENGAARIEKIKEGAETELPVLKEPSFD